MTPDAEALIAEARDPNTPFERLKVLSEHPEVEVRRALLDNPNVCPTDEDGTLTTDLLWTLAQTLPEEVAVHPLFVLHALVEPDEAMEWVVVHVVERTADAGLIETLFRTWGPDSKGVRQAIAENPSTPPEVLRILGNSKTESNGYVRQAVAANPSAPPDVLRLLGNPKTELVWFVRQAVASNPHTPEDTLRTLGNEQTEGGGFVRKSVASNPTTPLDTLRSLGNKTTESDGYVRVAVASNPHTPEDTLRILGNEETESDWNVRIEVARNPNTPLDTLRTLGNPATESVGKVLRTAKNVLTSVAERE